MTEPSQATIERLESRVASFCDAAGVPGCSAGVVVDGALVWSHGRGLADASGRRPDASTLYRVASITKTFTACAVLQLRDRGLLRLDDPLVAHVPEAAAITNPFGPVSDVTIRRLLLHTSGLQGEQPVDDPRVMRATGIAGVVADLPRIAVVIPPDTQTKYCNIGYQLLGAVIERVSGRPYMDHVASELLEPLGLASTAFEPDPGRCATGFDPLLRTDAVAPTRPLRSTGFEADGGLWSSVEDMARWIAFQLGDSDDVLARATREEMRRPWVVGDPEKTRLQGLCWYWDRVGDEWFVGHAGGLPGFISRIAMAPGERAGSIVLLNGAGDAASLAFELLRTAVDEIRARPKPEPSALPAAPPPGVADLLGRYAFLQFGEEARVEWRAGGLVLVDDSEQLRLSPTDDPDVYAISSGRGAGETMRFLRDGAGRVDGANLHGFPFVRL